VIVQTWNLLGANKVNHDREYGSSLMVSYINPNWQQIDQYDNRENTPKTESYLLKLN
jgi:hypothetical protein